MASIMPRGPYPWDDSRTSVDKSTNLATFIGGPWDLHRVRLSDNIPEYRVPIAPSSVDLKEAWDADAIVPMKYARYKLVRLPDPTEPGTFIPIYLYVGTK